jgi:nicotinamidase-related amidase
MGKKALLVIDMLRDFMDTNGALYCGDEAREIVPFVNEKIREFRERGDLVIFMNDAHAPDDLEFDLFPPHCVKGTPGAEIIDAIEVTRGDLVIEKTRYSCFYGTTLEEKLGREKVDEVHMLGVCTSICVMDTASGLHDRDIPIIVYREGVADFDPEAHAFALKRMERILGAKVI